MIPLIRRALISLAFAPWVLAAPSAVQRSGLPLVKSSQAAYNLDFNQISHALCALVHSTLKIIDKASLTSPVNAEVARCTADACIERSGAARESPASGTLLNTVIIKYKTQSRGYFPESQLSVDVGGTVINLEFLPTEELDPEDGNDGYSHPLTWQLLEACSQNPVGILKLMAPDELPQEGEAQHKGEPTSKSLRDEIMNKSERCVESSEMDYDKMKGRKREQTDYNTDHDTDRANEDEGRSSDDSDANPTDEELEEDERNLISPADRSFWSLATILIMTSSILIVAARLFYARRWGLVRSYRKPHRFHVGEAALLRWATEDMISDEELDTMANKSEETPLNPSPTKGFVIQYGSSL